MGIVEQLRADLQWYKQEYQCGAPGVLCDCYFWACANYRIGHWARKVRIPLLGTIARCSYRVLNVFVTAISGTEILPGAIIGQRLSLHFSRGVLVANESRIGDDCVLSNGVCIVNRGNFRGEGGPIVGNHVRFGVGAKVLGAVHIGDYVLVGANAVVLQDVPSHHIAVGIPAVCKPRALENYPHSTVRRSSDVPTSRK